MKYGKRLILCAVLIIGVAGRILSGETIEYYTAMDDSRYRTGFSFYADQYSGFIFNTFDSSGMNDVLDFSFNSRLLSAGRLVLSGVWLEMVNPFGYSAGSSVYIQQDGASGNFRKESGGVYGLYAKFPMNTDLLLINKNGLWAGAGKRIIFNDNMSVCGYIKVSEKRENREETWIVPDGFIPVHAPVYAGMEYDFKSGMFSTGFLYFLSGGGYLPSGYFIRLMNSVSAGSVVLKQLFVYSNGRYSPEAGSVERDKQMFSLEMNWYPLYFFSLSSSVKYRQRYPAAFPGVFIEKNIFFLVSSKISLSMFFFTATGSESLDFEKSGDISLTRDFKCGLKAEKAHVSVGIYAGIRYSGNSRQTLRLNLNAEYAGKRTGFYAGIRLESGDDPSGRIEGEITGRAEVELSAGKIFAASSFNSLFSPERTESFSLENLKIGWIAKMAL